MLGFVTIYARLAIAAKPKNARRGEKRAGHARVVRGRLRVEAGLGSRIWAPVDARRVRA